MRPRDAEHPGARGRQPCWRRPTPKPVVEPLAIDVVHREPSIAAALLRVERVVNADDRRVFEPAQNVELSGEARALAGTLERDISTEEPVMGAVHGPEAALAERGREVVATSPLGGELRHGTCVSRCDHSVIWNYMARK